MPKENETSTCLACDGIVMWIDSPTGGWWAHVDHPDDGHDADVD
jgi:hypothetical protein